MKIDRKVLIPVAVMMTMGLGALFVVQSQNKRSLGDEALLSLIKNDQKAFESFVDNGGSVQFELPVIDQHTFTVAEGIVYFERTSFLTYLQNKKISFIKQDLKRDYDILSLSIKKNNPELLGALMKESAVFDRTYGKNEWTLLHMASSQCSHKLISLLAPKIDWNKRAKDGTTPLTLAADYDCLPMLSYWKEHGADFKKKDGRGLTALDILRKKKDAALLAFAESFEVRKPATIIIAKGPVEPDFYKKRAVPKDIVTKDSDLVEPGMRPEDANETSEYSEFSD